MKPHLQTARFRFFRLAVGLALVLTASSASSISAAPAYMGCSGCAGTSGSQTTTSGSNMVGVTVDVMNGDCIGSSPACIASACEVTITRSWDLPVGTTMQHCIVRPPPQPPLCVYPPPVVQAPGQGSEVYLDLIRCGGTKTYNNVAGTLSAQASGSCSTCQ